MLKVLRSSADLQLYDSEFQTEEALTLNAFANNASAIRGTADCELRPRCRLVRCTWSVMGKS